MSDKEKSMKEEIESPKNRRKTFAIGTLCIALLLLLTAELISYFCISFLEGEKVSYRYLVEMRENIIAGPADIQDSPAIAYVGHPYLGFVLDNKEGDLSNRVNSFGFLDTDPMLLKKGDDSLNVGIFGGSVAAYFYHFERERMRHDLQSLFGHKKKNIRILSTAQGGYKQPQQLMALSYLLSLGVEFDIIINIDGFNEVSLPITDNLPKDVFAFYPRDWYERIGAFTDANYALRLGTLALAKERRSQLARVFNSGPLKYSYALNFVWYIWDRMDQRHISNIRYALISSPVDQRNDNKKSSVFGPDNGDRKELYTTISEAWKESSLLMHQLARANDADYFHVLQPNQYLTKKKLTPQELNEAFDKNSRFREPVEHGYPYLVEKGKELQREGVTFIDATDIFNNSQESLYIDTCCHFNDRGNDILYSKIIELITRSIKKSYR